MKVLQFITRLDLGGAQETCLDQCRLLLANGHEVHLLTGASGELMEDARGIHGLVLHAWAGWKHEVSLLHDPSFMARLLRLLRRERYDLLHTHSSKAGIAGRIAARIAGTPPRAIHHIHGWSFNATQPAPVREAFVLLEKLAAKPGFILLSCSRATDAQGRARGIGRDEDRRVIHYGIDRRPNLKRYDREALRRRYRLGHGETLFLQLGNLKFQKDPVVFAEAAVEAGRRLRRARFWIAGDGPLRGRAESIAERGGLGKRFRVLGWRRDVASLLAAADVLVLTSRFEGLPIAILRGMAAGLPVIATAVDGTPEAVAGERTGLLVPPGDPRAVSASMVRLGLDPGLRLRMGRAGREHSAAFSAWRATRELLGLYREQEFSSGLTTERVLS